MIFANDMAKLKISGTDCDELAENAFVASVRFSVLQNRLFSEKGTDF